MTLPDASTVLGFLSGIILFMPGWRGSRYLLAIEKVRREAEANKGREGDPGPELIEIMQKHHGGWNGLDHWMLMLGLLCLILSFALDFLPAAS